MKISKLAEWILNILCIAVIAYIGGAFIRAHEILPRPILSGAVLGKPLPIKSVDWGASPRTLVLLLSTDCHYCSASAGFYRWLMKRQDSHLWNAVAIFPQSVEDARRYLAEKGYSAGVIKQANLAAMGVVATPTLFLVNQHGLLEQQWIGQLDNNGERDVATHLGIHDLPNDNLIATTNIPIQTNHAEQTETSVVSVRSGVESVTPDSTVQQNAVTSAATVSQPVSSLITASDLHSLLRSGTHFTIVDVRDEKRYAYGHIQQSVNVPVNEMQLFAANSHSWSPDLLTVVYCNFSPACQAQGIPSSCSLARSQLRRVGVNDIRVIRDPLPVLKDAGVEIVGVPSEPPR